MEEVNQQQQRIRGTPSVSSAANRITLDGFELSGLGKPLPGGAEMESKRSSSSMQESLSSRSGSNDTLGIWDDVSYPEDSGDSEEMEGATGGEGGMGGEGAMLDSWIKELESGIKGMSGVAGGTTEVSQQ